jgi:hypothetical protein
MLSTILKAALLGAMMIIPVAVKADGINVGKYLCVVSHLAGIQYEKDGRTTSGNFQPAEKEFFLTIANVTPLEECPKTKMAQLNYWYFCLSKYAAQIDSKPVMRGDKSDTFIGLVGGDYLQLTDDLRFSSVTGILSLTGYYVSDGKCTKV